MISLETSPPEEAPTPARAHSRYAASIAHQQRAHALIPGGAHTYAKGDDQMPEAAPLVIRRGEGCHVWDLDGHRYIEYGMGLRAVTLGHAEPRVTAAAAHALQDGVNFSRPAAIELDAAERFLDLIEGAEMVKFCKDGSDATTAAVKLARAATGRSKVAICAEHPFLSQDDWFIGTTPMGAGIPDAIKQLTLTFPYGDAAALEALLTSGEIAAVVLEPARGNEDAAPYLRLVQESCSRHGTVLVFDEMITGFRWHRRGAQHFYGVTPDLSTFGKALANGFSVSALAGRRDLMERGGLHTEHPRVFLLSATHGAETHALAAAIETMRIYETEDVVGALHRQGKRLREGVEQQIGALGLEKAFAVLGRDCNLVFATNDAEGRPSQAYRTLLLQELLKRGILAPSFVVSAAHTDEAIDATIEAVGEALVVYGNALNGPIEHFLHGRPVKPVFRTYC